jgi:group I intron endonuclease
MSEELREQVDDIIFEDVVDNYFDEEKLCVYKITIDKMYVGITKDTKTRWKHHAYPSSKCRYIRNALLCYGVDNAKFEIIERDVSIEDIDAREQYYIEKFNTLAPNGYNLTSGGRYHVRSEETKALLKALWANEEHRTKTIEAMKIAQNRPEVKKKLRINMLKRWENDDYREEIRTTMLNVWADEEQRARRVETMTEAQNRPEAKELRKQLLTKRWKNDEEYREKMTKLTTDLWVNEAHREMRMSSIMKAHARPEECERKSKATEDQWNDLIKRERIMEGRRVGREKKQRRFEETFIRFDGDKEQIKTEMKIMTENTYDKYWNAMMNSRV